MAWCLPHVDVGLLSSAGKYDELKELLRRRLIESGWRDELKTYATELVQSKGEAQLTVEQLTADITPQGRGVCAPRKCKGPVLAGVCDWALRAGVWVCQSRKHEHSPPLAKRAPLSEAIICAWLPPAASVPDDVKAELLENIRSFVESHSSS